MYMLSKVLRILDFNLIVHRPVKSTHWDGYQLKHCHLIVSLVKKLHNNLLLMA